MPQKHRTYIAIDLKSFYASVECRERKLNPLTTNLVVADDLPCRVAGAQSVRDPRPPQAV